MSKPASKLVFESSHGNWAQTEYPGRQELRFTLYPDKRVDLHALKLPDHLRVTLEDADKPGLLELIKAKLRDGCDCDPGPCDRCEYGVDWGWTVLNFIEELDGGE